jgi:hypothetical protein
VQPKAVEVTVTEIAGTVLASQTALNIAKKVSQQVPRSLSTSVFDSASSWRRLPACNSAPNMSLPSVSSWTDSIRVANEKFAPEPSTSISRISAWDGLSFLFGVRQRDSGIIPETIVSETMLSQSPSPSHVASSAFGAFAPLALLQHLISIPYNYVSYPLIFTEPPLC